MFSLSLSLKWFRNGAFVISFFPPKTRQTQSGEKGQRGGIWEGVGEGEGRGKEKQVASTREREQISKPNIPREEKKKGESKNYWGTTFFFFFFSSFFFFSVFGESSKARFLRDCATIRVSQVKSSQVRQEEEQGEQSREREEGEGGRGCLYVCACFCVFV